MVALIPYLARRVRLHGSQEEMSLESAAAARCLVVLGEPGAGKTRALRRLYELSGESSPASWHALGGLRSWEVVKTELLDQDPEFLRWKSEKTELHVFLDGFDETADGVTLLGLGLHRELSRLSGLDGLRLRLGCRSMAWTKTVEERFQSLWGLDFRVVDLLPIDISDPEVKSEIDRDFLFEIVRRELGDLCSHPLTLFFLWQIWNKTHELPASRTELFEKGTRLLFEEPNDLRRDMRAPRYSPERLLEAGTRIAIFSVLGGRWQIGRPESGRFSSAGDLSTVSPLDIASSDPEWMEVFEETVRTAAFSPRDETVVWAHRVFAEYLAASGLSQMDRLDRLGPLFEHPDDHPKRRVAGPLAETSRWLAGLHCDWASWMIEHDPVSLISSEAPLSNDQRRELLDVLLIGVESGSLMHRSRDIWRHLRRLDHDQIASQLGDRLQKNPATPEEDEAWLLAVGIAYVCQVKAVAPQLLSVVLDDSLPERRRIEAAHFFQRVPTHLEALKELALGRTEPPPPPGLSVVLLKACYPIVISAVELVGVIATDLLRKGGPERAEALAQVSDLPRDLHAGELPLVMRLLEDQIESREWPERFVKGVVARAANCIADPAVREGLARLLGPLSRTWGRRLLPKELISLDANTRIDIALMALSAGTSDRHLGPLTIGLLRFEDLGAVISRLELAATPQERASLARLAWGVFRWDEASHIEAVVRGRELLSSEARFERYFTQWGEDAESIVHARQKAADEEQAILDAQARARRGPPITPPPAERIETALAELDNADEEENIFHAWWVLLHQLTLRPDSSGYGHVFMASGDFSVLPGWIAASETTRRRIRDGALRVLHECAIDPRTWLGRREIPAKVTGLDLAFRALEISPSLLDRLDQETWAHHAAIVVGRIEYDAEPGPIHEVLRRAAPEAAAGAVDIYLENSLDVDPESRDVTDLADRYWSPAMENLVRGRLSDDSGLSESTAAVLSAILLRHDLELPRGIWHRAAEGNGRLATELLIYRPDETSAHLADSLVNDEEICKAAIKGLAIVFFPEARWPGAWPSEKALGFLIRAIERWWPGAPDQSPSGFLGVEGRVTMLWNMLLRDLASRGTPEAVKELESFQNRDRYAFSLAQARDLARDGSWHPPALSEIMGVLDGQALVRSDVQLLGLIEEAIRTIEGQDLRGNNGLLKFLWEGRPPRPRSECDFSDMLAKFLKDRLQGVIVHREVEIRSRRGDSPGERVDLLVSAFPEGGEANVVVEVKPNWNEGLSMAIEEQLRRYLEENPSCHAGLLLVACFDSSAWDSQDPRRRVSRRQGRVAMEPLLLEQAKILSTSLDKDIRVHFLELGLEPERGLESSIL